MSVTGFKMARVISIEGLQVVSKKARQLSAEGLQVIFQMPRRFSAEGLQVVPDTSPETVRNYDGYEKAAADTGRRVSLKHRLLRLLNRKFYGIRLIWMVVAGSMFVTGILLGGALVASLESKGRRSPSIGSQTS
jgi:hypothetical protein